MSENGGATMSIANLSGDVLFVTLPKRPHLSNELENVNEMASDGCDRDIIIDFSGVEILISASICNLTLLEKFLSARRHQLVLCSVPIRIMCMFIRLGLETLFKFADDKSSALITLRGGNVPDETDVTC
jgi:anti-anti-sigma regulatory factor